LTKPQSWLGNFPLCPALVGNVDRVDIYDIDTIDIDTICALFVPFNKFAYAISCAHFTELQLDALAEEIETNYPELAVLWHHPASPRYIGDHKTPTPGIPLLIIQSRADLIAEKARLREAGYYKHWR